MSPDIDNLIVTLLIGNEAHTILTTDALHFLVTLTDELFLLVGNDDITEVEGQTTFVGKAITEVLDAVEELTSASHTYSLDNVGNDAAKGLLGDDIVEEANLLRDNLVGDDATYRGLNHSLAESSVFELVVNHHKHGSMHIDALLVVCDDCLFGTIELQASALCSWTKLCDVVQTEHHILRRNGDRRTIGRVQNVMRLKH